MEAVDRKAYRERLVEGEPVYFVGLNNLNDVFSADSEFRVRKGSVERVDPDYYYQSVALWSDVNERPMGAWVSETKSPRALFTVDEVNTILKTNQRLEEKAIDSLVQNTQANRKLASALFGVFIERMSDDLVKKPFDPEY